MFDDVVDNDSGRSGHIVPTLIDLHLPVGGSSKTVTTSLVGGVVLAVLVAAT